MDRSKKLLNNTLILLFGSILTKGINFIMAPLLTRWLSTEEYGTFDLLATYSTLLIPILAFGIHHAVFRFLLDDDSEDNISAIITNSIATNFAGIAFYIICVTIFSVFLGKITDYILLLTILLLAQTYQNYMGMLVRGVKKLKQYSASNVICTASILVFVYVFIRKFNMGLNGMILGYSIGYFLGGLAGELATHSLRYVKVRKISWNRIKKMLRYSIPMIPNSIAWWIVNTSARMIVSMVLGLTANAILAVAYKIPNVCTTLYDVLQTAWLENAPEAIKGRDWDAYFSKMLNVMSQFFISVSIIIVTTNYFLYDLLFTEDYMTGRYLVPLFALAITFNALSQSVGSVFIAEYNSRQQGLTMLIAGTVNIVTHLLLISFIGIYASAISAIISYAFLFVIRYKKVREKYKIKLNRRTLILAGLLFTYILLSYLDIEVINIIIMVSSILICSIANKDTLLVILRKMLNRK